jgi:energy-coupling factor transporter ATP-binding protein EcfA2
MKSGIDIQSVSFHYPDKPDVLKNISFSIEAGDFLGITGTNGSGKSTFSYLLNGIIPHSIAGTLSGKILVDGVDTQKHPVSFFAKKVGMVFQNPDFSLFNVTVEEEIAFGMKNLGNHTDKKKISTMLERVSLAGFESRDPQSLSFGEKQKVSIASVLALDVSYIVLDEPTAMLDYKSSVALYELLRTLNTEGKTIITIEHDTDFLWSYTKHTAIFNQGCIEIFGKTKTILAHHTLLSQLGIKRPHSIIK